MLRNVMLNVVMMSFLAPQAIPTNIRLGWKNFSWIIALAYFLKATSVTEIKSWTWRRPDGFGGVPSEKVTRRRLQRCSRKLNSAVHSDQLNVLLRRLLVVRVLLVVRSLNRKGHFRLSFWVNIFQFNNLMFIV